VSTERHVRLFRNGRNRAVRIPREFDVFGEEVVIRREGDGLLIQPPKKAGSIVELLHQWAQEPPLDDDDWLDFDDPPPEPVDF